MDQNTHTTTSQAVRYRDTIVQFPIVVINGIESLFLEDVQQRFPTVTSLCIDDRQLAFIRDENGNRLEPQRIKACKDKIIDALDPEGQSNEDIGARLNRLNESMHEMQKTVDLIQANTQEISIRLNQARVQMYELHEYTTPRYFYILPVDEKGVINTVKSAFLSQYKLYFLCECSNEPNQLHVAPHEGYLIKKPKEFIATYGAQIRTTLDIVRAVLTVGSIIPKFDNMPEFVTSKHNPFLDPSYIANIKNKLDTVEELLNQSENTITCTDSSVIQKPASHRVPLQGSQLRELGTYLENVDKSNSLGNLYRMITDDGHVRWVCLEHYDIIGFNNKISEYVHQFEAFGGKFNQDTKEAVITETNLTSENIETFCGLVTKGLNIVTLVFKNCSLFENDLDKLFDVIINRNSIRCLIISNLKIQNGRKKPIYACDNMSVHAKNQSLEIQLPGRCQKGDINIFLRLWRQNKMYQIFNLRGYGSFPEYGESTLHSLQTNQESKALIVNQISDIDFLNDILNRDPSLSQLKLNFCFSSPSITSRFCQTLGKNRTLVELEIMNYTGFDDEQFIIQILKSLRGHKSLKQLSLLISNLKQSDEKEGHLIDLLLNDSFFSRLRLLDSNISQELTQALVQASQNLHSLTYLELYNCQINNRDVLSLQSLRTNGNLTHLRLSNEQYWCVVLKEIQQQFQKELGQYQNSEIENIIQKHENESWIDLDGKLLTDKDMEIVVNNAIISKQCTVISLAENKITSIGAFILANALNNNVTLNALLINNNYLSDIGVYSLAKILSANNNNNLKILNLGSNGITDEGIKHLSHMLKTNKVLTDLYLSENNISDEGVQILANVIQNNKTTIEKLSLCGNKLLTDSSVIYLIQMIEKSSSLKQLSITDCDFSDKKKTKLIKAQQSKGNFDLSV